MSKRLKQNKKSHLPERVALIAKGASEPVLFKPEHAERLLAYPNTSWSLYGAPEALKQEATIDNSPQDDIDTSGSERETETPTYD